MLIRTIIVCFGIIALSLSFSSCVDEPLAHVFITDREDGFDDDNKFYTDITLKNDGEVPANFVIVFATAIKDGNEIDYKEREFGDIYPGGILKQRITFNLISTAPDSIDFELTWNNASFSTIGIVN